HRRGRPGAAHRRAGSPAAAEARSMSHNLRGRLVRLERQQPDRGGLLHWICQARAGFARVDDLAPTQRAALEPFFAMSHYAPRHALEQSVAGRIVRRELARLGLPQPDDLVALDDAAGVINEAIRLTEISGPGDC